MYLQKNPMMDFAINLPLWKYDLLVYDEQLAKIHQKTLF